MPGRARLWTLNGTVPEPCLDLFRWAHWLETAERSVARDELMGGDVIVATIFLGIDHNHSGTGAPILFQTIVFGEQHLGQFLGRGMMTREQIRSRRYSTWAAAEAGHQEWVSTFRAAAERAQANAAAAVGAMARP